jgi:hypothetical protein
MMACVQLEIPTDMIVRISSKTIRNWVLIWNWDALLWAMCVSFKVDQPEKFFADLFVFFVVFFDGILDLSD